MCEALPNPVSLTSSFGSYESQTRTLGDTALFYTRALEIRETAIPPDRYKEYRIFFLDVVKADRTQAVLISK